MSLKKGHDRVKELIQWGADFSKSETGNYDLAKEGGHSRNRILHYKDVTGAEIQRALTAKCYEHCPIFNYLNTTTQLTY